MISEFTFESIFDIVMLKPKLGMTCIFLIQVISEITIFKFYYLDLKFFKRFRILFYNFPTMNCILFLILIVVSDNVYIFLVVINISLRGVLILSYISRIC